MKSLQIIFIITAILACNTIISNAMEKKFKIENKNEAFYNPCEFYKKKEPNNLVGNAQIPSQLSFVQNNSNNTMSLLIKDIGSIVTATGGILLGFDPLAKSILSQEHDYAIIMLGILAVLAGTSIKNPQKINTVLTLIMPTLKKIAPVIKKIISMVDYTIKTPSIALGTAVGLEIMSPYSKEKNYYYKYIKTLYIFAALIHSMKGFATFLDSMPCLCCCGLLKPVAILFKLPSQVCSKIRSLIVK